MARDTNLQLSGRWRVRFTRILKRPIVEVEVVIPAECGQPFSIYFWNQATPEDLAIIGFPNHVNLRRAIFAGVKLCPKFRPGSKQQTS